MLDCVLNTLLALHVKEVYFGEESLSLINTKNQRTIKALLNGYTRGKCGPMNKQLKSLCCIEVQAIKYYEFLGMRYGDTNAVAEIV